MPEESGLNRYSPTQLVPWVLRVALSLAAGAGLASVVGASADPDPVVLIRQADSFRQLYDSAELIVRLTRYKGEIKDKDSLLHVAIDGSNKAVVKIIDGTSAGQNILMTNEGLWVKMPRTTKTVRITPIQRFMGEASYGDIGRMRWQEDYIANVNRQPQEALATPAWPLTLTAKSNSAVYARIDLWVAREDGRPLEAVFYVKSGKPVKQAQFGEPERINDKIGIRTTTFFDELKPGNRTVMVIERVAPRNWPDRKFALESLGEQ